MEPITVRTLGDDAYQVDVRGHRIVVDQPLDAGGGNAGPTPTELFVASLAACVAHYAGRALRHEPAELRDVGVSVEYVMSTEPPWRVTEIDVSVDLAPGVSTERRRAVERAVSHCTVHNSLEQPPQVTVSVGEPAVRAA